MIWFSQSNHQCVLGAPGITKLLYAAFNALSCSCGVKSMSSSCCCSSSASFSTMFFNLSRPFHIFSIILLYNKEAVSRTLCSISASASRVAATGADTAVHNFEIVFLKNVFVFYKYIFGNFLKILWT